MTTPPPKNNIFKLYNRSTKKLPYMLYSDYNTNHVVFTKQCTVILRDKYNKCLKQMTLNTKNNNVSTLLFVDNAIKLDEFVLLYSNTEKLQYIRLNRENNIEFRLVENEKLLTVYEFDEKKENPFKSNNNLDELSFSDLNPDLFKNIKKRKATSVYTLDCQPKKQLNDNTNT